MKSVLITGGAGFIGGYVVDELLKKDYKICILDDLSNSSYPSYKSSAIIFAKVNLANKEKARKYFKKFDKCIHLAAKSGGIGYWSKFPAKIISENNKIYSTVFELAAEYKYKRIIYSSSSTVSESTSYFPIREKDLPLTPLPTTTYAFSKLIGEYYCRAFYNEYGLPYTIIRLFNAYGSNTHSTIEGGFNHVIPDLIKKTLSGQYPIEILGTGKQVRCFVHASDIAKAIVMALENKKAINEDINIGNEEISILNLAKKIHRLAKINKPFKYLLVKGFSNDLQRSSPDISKAKKILGWQPKITLSKSLPDLIDWIKKESI